jgi:hypothetical protein
VNVSCRLCCQQSLLYHAGVLGCVRPCKLMEFKFRYLEEGFRFGLFLEFTVIFYVNV